MGRLHLVLRADDVEPFPAGNGIGYLSQHVLGEEMTGIHDMLLNRGTLARTRPSTAKRTRRMTRCTTF